ncbi:hypothetical protein HNR23_004386 [Nocardiopsis mwathae]|uniref:IrrE N-terminal-like domain-containing protein n=1 Tax=Nocardiopsis mwathae TaxID=1472723 RepID=A0A7W9YNH4_9ACTN|nr:hypothetical protein [Nocardiopsis mwathae]MBB6174326.1 hypothetical protein [Nocardiopsis mwathae]
MKGDARGWRNDLQLRRGVKQLLRQLDLDAPLDVRVLCERLGEHRGRPIKLVPHPLPVPGAFGLWVGTAQADHIYYQKETTPAHQDHIILHEIGHIISGHGGNKNDADLWSQVFPDLPPELIRRILMRDGYGPEHEREAEMVATVIKEWSTLLERLKFSPDRKTHSARRLRSAFDDHQGWL